MFTFCNLLNVHDASKVEAYSDEISIFIKKDFIDRQASIQENLVLQNLQKMWVEGHVKVIQGGILSREKTSRATLIRETFRPGFLNHK